MSLTLITGRANSGKTGRVYQLLLEAASAGVGAILALPTQPDVQRAVRELSRRCPLGIRVARLDDLIEESWRLRGDGRNLVGDSARLALCERVVSGVHLEVIAEEARGRGLASLLAQIVRRNGTDVRGDEGIARGIALLADAYRSHLDARGLVEAADAVRQLPRSQSPADTLIAAHRFTDLAPA
ncbi:MAG: hypothetical protein OEV43_05890, partial [Coriobacteriia bacterium]|nr:hypothetical protein [Coriobacteriia bacterium]